jgi:hypothetical protein
MQNLPEDRGETGRCEVSKRLLVDCERCSRSTTLDDSRDGLCSDCQAIRAENERIGELVRELPPKSILARECDCYKHWAVCLFAKEAVEGDTPLEALEAWKQAQEGGEK